MISLPAVNSSARAPAWLSATLIICFAAAPFARAAGDTWRIDPAHSAVKFQVRHLMLSDVSGRFDDVSGKVNYDGTNLGAATISVSIATGSVDTGLALRDKHLRDQSILNAAAFPQIVFQSEQIQPLPDGSFKIRGELSMHGVSQNVNLTAQPLKVSTDSSGKQHLSTTATGSLNRKDFGIFVDKLLDHGGAAVGESVGITLDVSLIKE